MKRVLVFAAFLVLPAFGGCSSGAPSDPTALTLPVAQNVSISQITILQALEVPVMSGGDVADRGLIPLVAQRDSILRVYVQPGDSFSPHTLTASARIVTTSPTGSFAALYSAQAAISGASDQSDLTTTINVPIPGLSLEPGSSITVVLNDTQGDSPTVATSDARWPQDGTLQDLDVRDGGDRLRVMIVPVEYAYDGSHRLPDTSDAQIEAYRERFFQLYPAAQVEISVHDPWVYGGFIDASGTGMDTILSALGKLRSSDQPDPDIYYYAAFEPAPDFNSYCGGGCVTGLTLLGVPTSVGIGYTGPPATDTAVHEVGHAHGLNHAPCGPVSGVDPNYPTYSPPGSIGVWGYDWFGQQMIDPATYKDMMSYCDPKWISDYSYGKIFTRERSDNKYFGDWMQNPAWRATQRRFTFGAVGGTTVHLSTEATREPWVTLGEPREITWAGGKATGYFFAYDHLPGGVVYVPDEVPAGASLQTATGAITIVRP